MPRPKSDGVAPARHSPNGYVEPFAGMFADEQAAAKPRKEVTTLKIERLNYYRTLPPAELSRRLEFLKIELTRLAKSSKPKHKRRFGLLAPELIARDSKRGSQIVSLLRGPFG